MLEDLNELIESNPDPRELKRAIAVRMFLQGYKHCEIQVILGVSSGFISKWTQFYEQIGAPALRMGYLGSTGYLEVEKRQSVLGWFRESYHLCKSFDTVKFLFEFATHRQVFDFPKLFTYASFSSLI